MEMITESGIFYRECGRIVGETVRDILDMCKSEGEIADVDLRVREKMGELGRKLLGFGLSERGSKSNIGREVKCACGGTARFKQNRRYQLGTVLPGKVVDVEAAYYVCPDCRKGMTPLMRELGTDGDGATIGLQELTVLAGTLEPYREAALNLLLKFSGVEVSRARIQRKSIEEGKSMEGYFQHGDDVPEKPAVCDELYVSIDGGMVHVDDQWQEAKVGLICDGDEQVDAEGRMLMARDIAAVRGGPEELAEAMDARLARFDLSRTRAVVLGDGAKWIWNLAEDMFPNRVEILDYYHAMEHLWGCANVLFGEGSDETKKWVEQQKKLLLDDKVEQVIRSLVKLQAKYRAPSKKEAIISLHGYMSNNAHRMRYKTFTEAGHPIGSGAVESAIKYVIQSRMKRAGMRWHQKGADSMLCLRSIYCSTGRWNQYWNTKRYNRRAA